MLLPKWNEGEETMKTKRKNMLKRFATLIAVVSCMFIFGTTSVFADEMQDNFIKDVAEGLEERWSYNEDEGAMSKSEYIEYRTKLVNAEYSRISKYTDTEFESEKFGLMASAYIDAIEMQLDALNYYEELEDVYNVIWSGGYSARAILIVDFVDHYGLDVPVEEVNTFREALGLSTIPTTTTAVSNIESESQTEIELFNNEGIRVLLTGMDEPTLTKTKFHLKVENLNHHDITISTDDFYMTVNGATIYSSLYINVQSGKTAVSTMEFWQDELDAAGIDKIRDMSFCVAIIDSNTYDTLYKGTEKFLVVNEDNQVSEKVVYTDKESIRKVQSLLNQAGYDCGSADGVPGKKTNSAILQFERDNGLAESTDITPELIEALEKAIG